MAKTPEPTQDPFGVRALILSKGMTQAEFARRIGRCSKMALNNWILRGIPGHRLFDAADILGMQADDLRPYTPAGNKPSQEADEAARAFAAVIKKEPRERQVIMLEKLKRLLEQQERDLEP
jgi:transcriptional regulator with XRE-family HTH domain